MVRAFTKRLKKICKKEKQEQIAPVFFMVFRGMDKRVGRTIPIRKWYS